MVMSPFIFYKVAFRITTCVQVRKEEKKNKTKPKKRVRKNEREREREKKTWRAGD